MKVWPVIAYIDGYNLYNGLKAKDWDCYYWLDLRRLCLNLLQLLRGQKFINGDYTLRDTKYFTSKVKGNPRRHQKQKVYLEALEAHSRIVPFLGDSRLHPELCENCGYEKQIPEEKITDVYLSTEMVADAFNDKYDIALLVSGDIDQVPTIEVIKKNHHAKKIVSVFPPMRTNDNLAAISDGVLHITENELKNSLLPDEIVKPNGIILKRPKEWF